MSEIHQVLVSAGPGDAITNAALQVQAKLRELGLLYVEVSGGREERFALAVQATQSALMRSKGRDGAQI